METTRTIGHRNTTKSSLPNITTPSISYSQRYEHMTKIANYNELNEAQIWKQYEKLRICLKELNEEVLFHMQKKAHTNLYTKQAPVSPTVEATLILIEQQRKTNESRLNIFNNQYNSLQLRVQHLTNKKDFLLEINNDIEITQAKIREITVENKDLKRKQKLISRDLTNGPSLLEKLLTQEQLLHFANKKYEKYDKMYKTSISKIEDLQEKAHQNQKAFEVRLGQFKSQDNYIEEEINLERYEELQNRKTNAVKYESVYKKNYLMKLKELQNLVNSINKHEEVIQQNQGNIMRMRSEIDSISSVVGSGRKRNSTSMFQNHNKSMRTGRNSIAIDNSLDLKQNQIRKSTHENGQTNDKNRGTSHDKN